MAVSWHKYPRSTICKNCGKTFGVHIGLLCSLDSRGAFTPSDTETPDPVAHPKHYTAHPSGVECIQITEHENFCIGNAIKYLWRAGQKDESKTVEDLRKAVWYIEREIKRIEGTK